MYNESTGRIAFVDLRIRSFGQRLRNLLFQVVADIRSPFDFAHNDYNCVLLQCIYFCINQNIKNSMLVTIKIMYLNKMSAPLWVYILPHKIIAWFVFQKLH